MKKRKYTDFFEVANSTLSKDLIERAKRKAQTEILGIRLSQLRELQGLRQEDIDGFTQSGISKLEGREDLKISTLLEYIDAIGMDIEILVRSKKKNQKPISLLKN